MLIYHYSWLISLFRYPRPLAAAEPTMLMNNEVDALTAAVEQQLNLKEGSTNG